MPVAIQAKKAKKSRYVVKNAKIFNSRRADFAPMYLDKNFDQLFFTSTNEKSVGRTQVRNHRREKSDIYVSKRTNREMATP